MAAIDSIASALYERLSSEQLRDLLAAYFGSTKAQELPQKSRDEITHQLSNATDPARLARLAHQIEALSPHKHSYLFSLANPDRWSFETIHMAFKKRFPGLDLRFDP